MRKKTSLFVTVKKGTKPASKKKEEVPLETSLPALDAPPVVQMPAPAPEVILEPPVKTSEQTVTKSGLIITKKIRQPPPAVTEPKAKVKPKKHERPPRPIRKATAPSTEATPLGPASAIPSVTKTKIVKKTLVPASASPTLKDDDDKESTTSDDDIATDDINEKEDTVDDKEDENVENIEKAPNREDLMDKLEIRKYGLEKKIKKSKKRGLDTTKYEARLAKAQRLLSEVKKVDAKLKAIKKTNERNEIIKSFKKKYKKLKDEEFVKKIDLTAPKKDREPEVGVALWKKSKDVVFADNKYKDLPDKKKKQVLTQITRKKTIEPELQDQIERKVNSNFQKINVELNHANLLAYKKYNPLNYQGIVYY